jgi:DNA adenine methylase
MTGYHGGKQRIGKYIADIINERLDNDISIKGYCEPFCGMLGVYSNIDCHPDIEYLAGDIDADLIEFWSSKGIPTSIIARQEYDMLKSDTTRKAERGFYGFYNGFANKKFSGYFCHPNINREKSRFISSIKRIENFHRKFPSANFSTGDYTQYSKLRDYIIYCDPPYENSRQHYLEKFDSEKFYSWCNRMSKHNVVYVSSYIVPNNLNWKVVWEKPIKNTCGSNINDNDRIERLYMVT